MNESKTKNTVKAIFTGVFAAVAVIYFFAPVDLIPDIIPVFGLVDDLIIATLAAFVVRRMAKSNPEYKKPFFSAAGIVLLFLFWQVFIPSNSTVRKVKNTVLYGQKGTVEEGINLLAGSHGKIEWKSFESEKSPGNEIVEVTVTKPENLKVEYRTARFQYTVRKDNGLVQPSYMEFNGKPDSLMLGAVKLQIMMAESANGK